MSVPGMPPEDDGGHGEHQDDAEVTKQGGEPTLAASRISAAGIPISNDGQRTSSRSAEQSELIACVRWSG
jgi:hypothetical protein